MMIFFEMSTILKIKINHVWIFIKGSVASLKWAYKLEFDNFDWNLGNTNQMKNLIKLIATQFPALIYFQLLFGVQLLRNGVENSRNIE